MHINVNAFHNYKCRYLFNNNIWKNFKQKLSIDEIYNISRVKTKLVILFCKNKHYQDCNEAMISKDIFFYYNIRNIRMHDFRNMKSY